MGWIIGLGVVVLVVVLVAKNASSDRKTLSMSDEEHDNQMTLTDGEFRQKWGHDKPQAQFRNSDAFILQKRGG